MILTETLLSISDNETWVSLAVPLLGVVLQILAVAVPLLIAFATAVTTPPPAVEEANAVALNGN